MIKKTLQLNLIDGEKYNITVNFEEDEDITEISDRDAASAFLESLKESGKEWQEIETDANEILYIRTNSIIRVQVIH